MRYLDTDHGRWTQRDPTRQEANTYLYSNADPCNLIDPSGAHWTRWASGALELVGGISTAYDFYQADTSSEYPAVFASFMCEATVTATCSDAVIGLTGGIGSLGILGCSAAGVAAGGWVG